MRIFRNLPIVTASLALASFIAVLIIGCGGGGAAAVGSFSTQIVTAANFPTAIRVAPDGRIFYTEKNTGNVRIIQGGTLLATPFATVPVATASEQGLNGLAFDPDFANNGFVYIFYSDGNSSGQRIARLTATGNTGTNFTVILDNIPRGSNHNGGKLEFGQDGKLYATVGENGDPANAQLTANLAGKVLRMNPDGTIPGDNPTPGSYIYTLGHRNMFGMAVFPSTGRLYISENGPTCDDELNRLVPGGNYGWRPGQPCGDTDPNYVQPLRRYGSIIAPTGLHFYTGTKFPTLTGDLLMTNFVEGSVRRLTISDSGNGAVLSESILLNSLGSALDVTSDSSGDIFIATDGAILKLVQN
jgi:glucose/arabinose dehydrogenase